MIDDILIRYPQLELYLKSQHLSDVADLLKDPQGNKMKNVDIEGFKLALSQVDSQMKNLPATAQVCLFQLLDGLNFSHRFMMFCLLNDGTKMYSHFWVFRLLLNRVHIFRGALTSGRSAKRIRKVLDVLEVLGVTSFFLLGMLCIYFKILPSLSL